MNLEGTFILLGTGEYWSSWSLLSGDKIMTVSQGKSCPSDLTVVSSFSDILTSTKRSENSK